ncbi:MAG: DUF4136 domain-containing protein [Terriglobia bacterium]|jgi:hypothetical protein
MRKNGALLIAVAVSAICLFAKTVVDYDHAVNFAKYHTYSWISVDVQEPLWKDRVTNAVDGQLSAKGWRKVPSGGDAAVSAVGATHNQQTLETWYGGGFGGGWYHRGWWGGPGNVETEVENTPVGTLHIDIFDTQTKKVIWHASVSDTLSPKPDKNEKKMEKTVEEVFKKFPPTGK